MKKMIAIMITSAFFGLSSQVALASDGVDAAKLFSSKCKMCHSMEKNKAGPAVKNMSSDAEVLKTAFTTKRVKMMKGVNKKLSEADIEALVAFIQSNQ